MNSHVFSVSVLYTMQKYSAFIYLNLQITLNITSQDYPEKSNRKSW